MRWVVEFYAVFNSKLRKPVVGCTHARKHAYVHTEIYNEFLSVSLSLQSNLQTTQAKPPCSLYRLPISSTLRSITHLSRLSIGTPWPIEGTRVRPRRLLCPPSCKPHPSPSSCRTAGSLAVMYHWKAGNTRSRGCRILPWPLGSLRAQAGSRLRYVQQRLFWSR